LGFNFEVAEMEILIWLGLLVLSLFILVFSADKLIDFSVKLAAGLGISSTFVGLTLLAYGSSLPEFMISAVAAYNGIDQLSISNIVGSNIFNVAFILGSVAIISPIRCRDKQLCLRDGGMMTLSAVALSFLIISGGLSRFAGGAMVLTMLVYLTFAVRSKNQNDHSQLSNSAPKLKTQIPLMIALSFIGVLAGGYLVVNSAATMARLAGISDWLIGATIIAAGTSLPEFTISLMAAKRGEMGLSLGNIVGSNIFNILLILGASALIRPLAVSFYSVETDLLFLVIVTLLLQLSLFMGKITKLEGMGFLAIYLSYVLYLTGHFPVVHWPL
jgi:cation:H+ antiporter